jgi:DNA-directed RNA polymerase
LYRSKEDNSLLLNTKDLYNLTKIITRIVFTEFPKLKQFNEYFKNIGEICSNLNITINWVLPSGLSLNQYYLNSEAIRLKPFTYRKNTFNLKIRSNKLNKQKQIRALMPNLIHSLDAASLALIVEILNDKKGNVNFFSIHDCLAVSANNVENLIKTVKMVYIKIYSDNNYLRKFDEGIINSIKLHYGEESFNNENKTIKINNTIINYPNVDAIIRGKIEAYQIEKASYPIT